MGAGSPSLPVRAAAPYPFRVTVDELHQRLQVLEDERAILKTLHRYGHSMDYGPDADFVDCFQPDGVWEVRMRVTGHGFRCDGHAQLEASLAGQTQVRAPACPDGRWRFSERIAEIDDM